MTEARWTMQRFAASDGLSLAYTVDDHCERWSEAQTLLLIHAAMGSSRRFYAWVPHLSRHYRVVRIDQRGHGESQDPGPDQLRFDRLVDDARELLDRLGVERAHVAGSSAGAIVAQALAARHPQRVASLASFAGTPGLKHGNADYSGWVRKIGEKGVAGFLRETIAERMKLSEVDPGLVDWFIADAARSRPEVLARFVPMMRGVDLSSELSAIRCPTLCVAPGGDPLHTVDEYRVLQHTIPDCRFVVYEGLPHNITDAVPDRCALELLGFLKGLNR